MKRLALKRPADDVSRMYDQMSTMGAIAAGVMPESALPPRTRASRLAVLPEVIGSGDVITHSLTAPGTQGETSLAANANGSILIAGYNDSRGFASTPVSLSGVARSTDGGVTWNEVPVGPGGTGTLPSVAGGSVFGDPEVKYDVLNDRFVYASIFVRPSDGRQGLSISISGSGATAGTSWSAPVEVTPAFSATVSADKEFMDVNPITGRILITWTNFPNTGSPAIVTTFSDDSGVTWAPLITLETAPAGAGVQSSEPRFIAGTTNANSTVFAVWRNSAAGSGDRNIRCSQSADGGATWSAPVNLDTAYPFEDQIQGVDRINTSPSIAVDYTSATKMVYVAYQRNSAVGTGDIALRAFPANPGCVTGTPVLLNADPGNDRAQFYPFAAVDQSTTPPHVHVAFYDQIGPGDLGDVRHTWSADAGATWTPPTPLTDHPFHFGYGNDTSQPNLGDYNQAVAFGGKVYSLFASTSVQPRFDEGQPATQMITPDVYFDVTGDAQKIAPLRISGSTVADPLCAARANGNIDPGERINLNVTVQNYVVNAVVGAQTLTNIVGTLSTTTPGVTINTASANYANLAAGASEAGTTPFVFTTSTSFVPGTYIDFIVSLATTQGTIDLPLHLATGTAGTVTTLLSENFDAGATNALPAGWSSVIAGGTGQTAWTVATTLTASRAAFHDDGTTTGFIRLFAPVVAVPASATPGYVTVDFDLQYNLEDEPTQLVQAYDGLTLRITDQTAGATVRSVLAEAFAERIRTGSLDHFPKHLPRSGNAAYFQDMSVWSGDSGGIQHVSMKFPGAGLTGRSIQLRFEYTQDGFGSCAAGTCGVAVDNVVVNFVPSTSASCLADLAITKVDTPDPVVTGGALSYTVAVTNNGPSAADNVVVTDILPAGVTFVSAIGAGWICAHASGTVSCSRTSLASGASASFTINVTAPAAAGMITNTATVSSAQPDPNSANNSASATTSVQVPAHLTATKTFTSTRIVGDAVVYTIVISNTGGVAQGDNAGNELSDVLPAQLTLVSASATSGTAVATVGTNTVTWNGAVPAAGTVTVTINATINAGTAGQTATNQGTVSYDSNLDNVNDATALTDDPGVAGAANPTSFTIRAVTCGDGVVSAGEQCDDSNTTANDCCSPTCQFESATTVCRAAANACDVAETCDGAGVCAADVKAANGTPCPNATVCDGNETCMAGTCTAGTALDCNDSDACTSDSCNATTGCAHANICTPDLAGGVADMSGGADLSSGGTDDLGGPLIPDMAKSGDKGGCSCDIGGARRTNSTPTALATMLLVGLFGWRIRRRRS